MYIQRRNVYVVDAGLNRKIIYGMKSGIGKEVCLESKTI